MAGEWQLTTLGSIAKQPYGLVDGPFGSNLPASSYTTFGIPVIRGGNLSLGTHRFKAEDFVFVSQETAAALERSLCRPCDIVFTKKGTIGQTGFVPINGQYPCYLLSSNQMKLSVDTDKADPLFIYYLVSSPANVEKIIRDSEATGVPKTNVAYFRDFPIQLPPLPEQKAIASILGALDDKIELNRRMNATLEAMARALFQSWFVDFDPVRAKLDGRQPAGLAPATAALFPASFQDSPLGLIPAGWRVVPISELCRINARSLTANDLFDSVEYVEISEVSRGNIAHIQNYRRTELPSRARRRLAHGDTVLSTVRPDRQAHFLSLDPPGNRVVSTGFAVLSPHCVPWSLCYSALTQDDFSDYLGKMADGGAYPAVNPEIIGKWSLAIPSSDELMTIFHAACAGLYERAEANRNQVRTLSSLRDNMLPELLNGNMACKNSVV
jgi:type I restriction enzyme S subunit